jgi:DNA-binding MarR family transcriptional regulator
MNRIQFALCGNPPGPEDELNPYKVTALEVRQEILSLINLAPLTSKQIADQLKLPVAKVGEHLEAMERPALVKRVDERYKPSFAILTLQDQERLKPLIDELSRAFVETIQESMNLVHDTYAACAFSEHGFSFDDIAYILVGAYAFDYGGLGALAKAGFLTVTKEMPGGDYVFTGFEGESVDLRNNWQWGHNDLFGRFTFSGHGEVPPEEARSAFPEQAWRWQYAEGWSEEEVVSIMEDIGEILLVLYASPLEPEKIAARAGIERGKLQEHLDLLQKLEYLRTDGKRFFSACPMVDPAARQHIREMVEALQSKLIETAIRPRWERMARIYNETSPATNEIDIREGFNMIYHSIFEQALQSLMEQEIISWPKRHADGVRYAVWVQYNAR